MIATTVIIFGRKRSTAPSLMAAFKSARVKSKSATLRAAFRDDASQRDESDSDRNRHVEAEPPEKDGREITEKEAAAAFAAVAARISPPVLNQHLAECGSSVL